MLPPMSAMMGHHHGSLMPPSLHVMPPPLSLPSMASSHLAHLRNHPMMSLLPPAPVSLPAPPIPISQISIPIVPPPMAHLQLPQHHHISMPPPPPQIAQPMSIPPPIMPPIMNILAPHLPPPIIGHTPHSPHKHRPLEVFDKHMKSVITSALMGPILGMDDGLKRPRPTSSSSTESADSLKHITHNGTGPKYPIPTSTQLPTLNLYHNYVSRKISVSDDIPPPLLPLTPVKQPAAIKLNSALVSSHIDAVLECVAAGHDMLTTESEMYAKSQEKSTRRKRRVKEDILPPNIVVVNGGNGNVAKRKRIGAPPMKLVTRSKKERLKPISLVRSNQAESWLINKDEVINLVEHQPMMMAAMEHNERTLMAAHALLAVATPPQSPPHPPHNPPAPPPITVVAPPPPPPRSVPVITEVTAASVTATVIATPQQPPAPPVISEEDRYSEYDKHFKKKFFVHRSIALNNKNVSSTVTRTPQQRAILEERLGKFNEVNN